MIKLNVHSFGAIEINKLPDKCPFCHKSITPQLILGHKSNTDIQAFITCPNQDCNNSFIAYYTRHPNGHYNYSYTSKGTIQTRDFDNLIIELSPDFIKIHNQAHFAEQEGLFEICGVGYRKSLEFLIKDYSISKHDGKREEIEKKNLGKCIDDYIEDNRIKAAAKRATWLGNDETHYIRKWEGKNLDDLKKLIELTIHWIIMEALTDSFEKEMPG